MTLMNSGSGIENNRCSADEHLPVFMLVAIYERQLVHISDLKRSKQQ